MTNQPRPEDKSQSGAEPQYMADTSGAKGRGRGRQSVGEAFVMSMIRQIARSIGQALVRAVIGGRR